MRCFSSYKQGLRKRWAKELSLCKPEYVTVARAKGLTPTVLDAFFTMFGNLVDDLGIKDKPDRFYNLDETGLSLDPKKSKAFYHRGSKNVQYVVPSEGKTMFTVLFCCNAAGNYLPPYVIYKGQASNMFDTWMIGGPPNTSYNMTKSGWMEDYVFEAWFKDVFLPFVADKEKPIVVLFDGHGSHLTHQTAVRAKQENVAIVCLPPHTSSALQPLDVGDYGPAKKSWYGILQRFYRESRQKTVTKPAFPALLNTLYCTSFIGKPGNLVAGFKKAGLCPLNKDAVPSTKLVPSFTLSHKSDANESVINESDVNVQSCAASTSSEPSFSIIPISECTPKAKSTPSRLVSNLSPKRAMRAAILAAIQPPQSGATSSALQNAARKRKRVQRNHGEVLTFEESLARLEREEHERVSKKQNKENESGKIKKKTKGKSKKSCKLFDEEICYACKEEEPPRESDEESGLGEV